MALWALGIFLVGLFFCVVTDLSILWALGLGVLCFGGYARYQGHSFRAIGEMIWSGVKNLRNILTLFFFIGLLTASWRASGTIAFLVTHAVPLVSSAWYLPSAFFLCAGMSFLTGSAFASASTMGFVVMMLGHALGVNSVWAGGAILSGVFFGDRSSPMSSSAMLVATMTDTSLYTNLRNMLRSAAVPFLLTAAGYAMLSLSETAGTAGVLPLGDYFGNFSLSPLAVLPAAIIPLLSCFRMQASRMMAVSVGLAVLCSIFVQGMDVPTLLHSFVFGYHSPLGGVAAQMLDGGGLLSMVKVTCIVTLSASYFGIFKATGMLDRLTAPLLSLAGRIGRFPAVLISSVLLSMLSCNQSLATMLMVQFCGPLYRQEEREAQALDLEDSVILVAGLIPWSIAGGVPLASVGADTRSMLFAFYLFLIPVWRVIRSIGKKRG